MRPGGPGADRAGPGRPGRLLGPGWAWSAPDRSTLGTADRPSQLRIAEGPYRHVSEVRLACTAESDLVAIAARLERLGVASSTADGVLRCHDPLADHDVVVEVGAPPAADPTAGPTGQRPGPARAGQPAVRRRPCARCRHRPRRVGHVVFGSPDVAATVAFYRDGLGFKVSDVIDGGIGCFLRCSTDHHNLLVMPAPVPCMNHYAVEMDDLDAIGLAGMRVVAERPDASVYGPGRHVLGANLFWYLLDPAGGHVRALRRHGPDHRRRRLGRRTSAATTGTRSPSPPGSRARPSRTSSCRPTSRTWPAARAAAGR